MRGWLPVSCQFHARMYTAVQKVPAIGRYNQKIAKNKLDKGKIYIYES